MTRKEKRIRNNEIKKHPQERQLYVDAVAIVSKAINITVKERKMNNAKCNNS